MNQTAMREARGVRVARETAEKHEQRAAKLAEARFRPLIRELFRVLPLENLNAEVVSKDTGDFDVRGITFFADPLVWRNFRKFIAERSKEWKTLIAKHKINQKAEDEENPCTIDFCSDVGGTLLRTFACDGEQYNDIGFIASLVYAGLERKIGAKNLDLMLDELDRYLFTAKRNPVTGRVAFRVYGFNPNTLRGVEKLPRRE